MMRRRSQPAIQRERRGMISMELIFTLPLLMLLLMAILEFSLLMYARGDVVQAARAGARLGALHGAQVDDVEREVGRALGRRFPHYRVQAQLGEQSGDEVTVAVSVPMSAAAPNLLWPVGYNIRERDLKAQARLLKE